MKLKSEYEIDLCYVYPFYTQPEGTFIQYFYITVHETKLVHIKALESKSVKFIGLDKEE